MGSNYPSFLQEANRILKPGGTLFIAEVTSRLDDCAKFAQLMKKDLGFKVKKVSKVKEYFYLFVFKKVAKCKRVVSEEVGELFKPCLYKRR